MRLPKKYLDCHSERGVLHCEFLSKQHLQGPATVCLMASADSAPQDGSMHLAHDVPSLHTDVKSVT